MNDGRMTPELLNRGFLDAEQYINPVLANYSRQHPSLWRSKIQRGIFTFGEGYSKKARMFHGGQALQDGNRTWEQMQPSRAPNPTTGDPGYDACRYDAPVIGYGIEEKQYTIFQTTRRTTDICLTDLLFKWQFAQQLKLMYGMLSNVTMGEWENWSREVYVNFSTKFAAAPGMPEFTANMGMDEIDVSALDIGTIGQLNNSMLERFYMYMYRQCPMAALAQDGGMPVYGLVTSAETSNDMLVNDPWVVENYRHAVPQVLIDGIGSARTYKGFAHIMDPMTMRFRVKASDPTKLERVWPYKFTPTTVGEAVNIDPEYVNAPFELSVLFLNDVFKALVPPGNPTEIGGHTFGPQDNMGDFKWLNIQDRENNLLNEKGFYFARFRAAPEPGQYHQDAVTILHRRCTGIKVEICNTGDMASALAQNIVSIANYDSDATTNTKVIVTLAASITAGIGDAVTLTDANAADHTGVVTDDSGKAQYVIDLGAVKVGGWAAFILDGSATPKVIAV
jgi:hypothetical protein